MNENRTAPAELTELCAAAHTLADAGEFDRCRRLLAEAMGQHPDAPEPHNLLGLLLERMGDHAGAMKHFRAAWSLDPSYRPAQQNLDVFGIFPAKGKGVWQDSSCPSPKACTCVVMYDARGFGRCVKK